MGMNPDGYHVEIGRAAINMVVWVLIAGALIVLCLWKEKIWKSTVLFATVILLGMQATAWVSLMLSADDKAYHYEEGAWYISGENQYTVSANKNIIVFVLDYFSNQYLEPALYANIDEYSNIIVPRDNRVRHENPYFYQGLVENGLTVDRDSNYYIVQHLMETHMQTTTAQTANTVKLQRRRPPRAAWYWWEST